MTFIRFYGKVIHINLKEMNSLNSYKCNVCGFIYDEANEKIKFEDLPDNWVCPLCGVNKDSFEQE